MNRPVIVQLDPPPQVLPALRAVADMRCPLLLDSAQRGTALGRYSFLTADPFEFACRANAPFGCDPLAPLRDRWLRFAAETVDGLPPFQGGAAGLASYELAGAWEKLPVAEFDEFQLPALAAGLYDWVLAWDHLQNTAWIIAHGFPATEPTERRARAQARLQQIRERLAAPTPASNHTDQATWEPARWSKQWPAPGPAGLTSDFSRERYLATVERVIEYIRAGELFQANLSQRLLCRTNHPPLRLYENLRQKNPAPFSGYLAVDDWAIISASPERFVQVRGQQVETRPIKGTRQRRPQPEADLFARDELRESEKDQAENVMIVDLLRNDLSRVCQPHSIRVSELCGVETYETVQHLVSEIQGTLKPESNAWDLLQAVFPGGSITGAPKIRAMQVIAELEPTVRGPYCGSLFYVGFDGQSDSNILIRTWIARRGWIQCGVGGGIVAQSDPVAEYEETLHKAEGMLRALQSD